MVNVGLARIQSGPTDNRQHSRRRVHGEELTQFVNMDDPVSLVGTASRIPIAIRSPRSGMDGGNDVLRSPIRQTLARFEYGTDRRAGVEGFRGFDVRLEHSTNP